jgi:hypothetical protein
MNEVHQPALREQLLGLERFSPELESRFRKEIKNMIEKRLNWPARIAWALSGVMSLGFVGLFSYLAATIPPELPLVGRLGFVAGALFGLAWAIVAWRIVKRGAFSLKSHSGAITGIVWCFVVAMMTVDLYLGASMKDPARGCILILSGLVFVVMFGVPQLIMRRVEMSEIRVEEHLLKLELQLAELAEKTAPGPKGP